MPCVDLEQKLQIVLSVLRGKHTVIDAVRRNAVSEQSVHNWKQQFARGRPSGDGAGSQATFVT